MRLDQTTTLNSFEDRMITDAVTPTINGDLGGGSNIIEPEILNPVGSPVITPVKSGSGISIEQNEVALENPSDVKSDDVKEPSATTDENKIYGGGGTTPDSKIVINKPRPNYLVYGIVGIIGALVIYKVFLKKQTN